MLGDGFMSDRIPDVDIQCLLGAVRLSINRPWIVMPAVEHTACNVDDCGGYTLRKMVLPDCEIVVERATVCDQAGTVTYNESTQAAGQDMWAHLTTITCPAWCSRSAARAAACVSAGRHPSAAPGGPASANAAWAAPAWPAGEPEARCQAGRMGTLANNRHTGGACGASPGAGPP